MDYSIFIIILQLIFLEGLLSIDNAAVLGTLVVKLPKDIPVPWPVGMKKFGDSLPLNYYRIIIFIFPFCFVFICSMSLSNFGSFVFFSLNSFS